MLDNLSNEWTKFTEALVESEVMLKKYKEKFKTSLLAQAEDFKKQVKYSSVASRLFWSCKYLTYNFSL